MLRRSCCGKFVFTGRTFFSETPGSIDWQFFTGVAVHVGLSFGPHTANIPSAPFVTDIICCGFYSRVTRTTRGYGGRRARDRRREYRLLRCSSNQFNCDAMNSGSRYVSRCELCGDPGAYRLLLRKPIGRLWQSSGTEHF